MPLSDILLRYLAEGAFLLIADLCKSVFGEGSVRTEVPLGYFAM